MNNIYQHYIIDLSSNNNFVQIPTVQGDGNNIRGFEVELIENGIPYTINRDDCIIAIMGTKPDTCEVMNECQLTDEGYIVVDITSQMSAVKGRGDYQIVLMSKSTNSQIKSFPFYILTTPATFDVDYIVSSDEFQLLTHKITQTSVVTDNALQAITDIRTLETSAKNAENGRIKAEQERAKAETSRASAESIRDANENTRKTNETARQSAETTRIDAEQNRASAESIRVSNENTRISNEDARKANESNRQASEIIRSDAETDRTSAEIERVNAENIRVTNENSRKTAELARQSAETIRITSEDDRVSAETIRQNNESSRQASTAAAITNADMAADRANRAAENCEDIVTGTGFIMNTEKGAANGIATLDETQKLIRSQLPATEILSSTEPVSNNQSKGDFWLQEYQ